jgi:hypothetical protein
VSDRYLGMVVIEDPSLTKAVEDWSRVRSPGRAARRRKKHRQNIRVVHVAMRDVYEIGGKLVMHPEVARELRRRTQEDSTSE